MKEQLFHPLPCTTTYAVTVLHSVTFVDILHVYIVSYCSTIRGFVEFSFSSRNFPLAGEECIFDSMYTSLLPFQHMAARLLRILDIVFHFFNFKGFGPKFSGISFILWRTILQDPIFLLHRTSVIHIQFVALILCPFY
jgi:hypothetical protein